MSTEDLKLSISKIKYLAVIEDASSKTSLAVIDRRSGLGVSVDSQKALNALVVMGAEKYLESEFNFRQTRKPKTYLLA